MTSVVEIQDKRLHGYALVYNSNYAVYAIDAGHAAVRCSSKLIITEHSREVEAWHVTIDLLH